MTELANIESGFDEFADLINELGAKAADERTQRKVLAAGAAPIVERAKRIMKNHRRTGRLEESIMSEYNERNKTQDIGWGGALNKGAATGFYGRFLERGYRPATGRRSTKFKKLINKRSSSKLVQIPHLMPAYEAEKENVADIMIKKFKDELDR